VAHDELVATYALLREEIDQLAEAAEHSDGTGEYPDPATLNPITRRLLMRSVYAFVEAMAYRIKQDAVESASSGTLTAADHAICVEQTYELASNGQVETRRAKLRTLNNLRFAFDVGARAYGSSFILNVTGVEWQALQRGLTVRDRLMHPKSAADLAVTDEEIRTTMKGFHWIHKQVLGLITSQTAALEAQVTRLRASKT
jgi:hypothetical protein